MRIVLMRDWLVRQVPLLLLFCLIVGAFLALGVGLSYQYWDNYQNRTIRHVETTELNIAAHSMPATLTMLLQSGASESQIKTVLDSAFSLIGFFVTDCMRPVGACPGEKILYRSSTKRWIQDVTADALAGELFAPLVSGNLGARFSFQHAYDKVPEIVELDHTKPAIGRLYFVRAPSTVFWADFSNIWNTPKFLLTSGRIQTYLAFMTTTGIGGVLAFLLALGYIGRKKREAIQLAAERDEARFEVAKHQAFVTRLEAELVAAQGLSSAERQKREGEIALQRSAAAEAQERLQSLAVSQADDRALPQVYFLQPNTQRLGIGELLHITGLESVLNASTEVAEIIYNDRYLNPLGAQVLAAALAEIMRGDGQINPARLKISTYRKVKNALTAFDAGDAPAHGTNLVPLPPKERIHRIEEAFAHLRAQVTLDLDFVDPLHMRFLQVRTRDGRVARAYLDMGMRFVAVDAGGERYWIAAPTYIAIDPFAVAQ